MGPRAAGWLLVLLAACGGGGTPGGGDAPGPGDLPFVDARPDGTGEDPGSRPEVAPEDGGEDGDPGDPGLRDPGDDDGGGGADAATDGARDAEPADIADDSGPWADLPADAAPDAVQDAAPDALQDTAADAAADAARDAEPADLAADPGPWADLPADAAPDAVQDAATDAAPDAAQDASPDATQDAADAAPDGGPEDPGGFPIPSVETGDQAWPSVAARPGGGWWVAWQTRPPEGGDWQVAGRCLHADGRPASAEVRLSTEACVAARRPAVAVSDDGALWVAYEADGLDGSGSAVGLRRLPACDGTPGPEWLANAFTSSFQGAPALAPLAGGTVVAAWQSECRGSGPCDWLDGSWAAVAHRRAGPSGPLGDRESVANRFVVGDQYQPALAAVPGGGWWVAWAGAVDLPSVYDVFLDRFDGEGRRLGDDLRVNDATAGAQSVPRACALAGGGAAVAWMDWDVSGTATDVRARLLGADGAPATGDLDLAADPLALESSVALAADPGGGFRAAWRRRESPAGPGSVRWRAYGADGSPRGAEGTASGEADGDAGQPALAVAADGAALLVFTSASRDGSGTGIVGVALP